MLHCQIHPKFTLSFIWVPPPTFSLSATNAKLCEHLQLPLSLCLTLPPTSIVPQFPPEPSLFSQAIGATSVLWPGLWFTALLGTAAAQSSERSGAASTQTTEAAQLQHRQNQHRLSWVPAPRQQRFLGPRLAAEPSTGTELRGSSARAQHLAITHHMFLPSKRTNQINKTRGSEERERQGWKSQTASYKHLSFMPQGKQGRQGSRGKSQGSRRL